MFLPLPGYYGMQREYRLSQAEEAGLRRWLYLANARAHYSGSSETVLDADLNTIARTKSAEGLLEASTQQVGRLEVLPSDLAGRGQRSALFSMAYLALRARGAKDWRTRLGLSLTHQGRYHFIEHHHIFPKAQLKKTSYDKSEVHEIANMAFVSGRTNRSLSAKPADEYLTSVLEEQGPEALEAHCIPLEPELWKIENYRDFLEYRRGALAAAINAFINQGGAAGDRLDLEALIADGESDELEFKESLRWDTRESRVNKALEAVSVKTISGFLNGKGGRLLLGVKDSGEVLGLDADYRTLSQRANRDGYQQHLVNLISTALGRHVCANLAITFHPVDGRDICMVTVRPASAPVYSADGESKRFFLRTGNTTRELDTRETVEYIRHRWPER
jgi:hypothetical protein